ncbi:hypothetical protein LZ198_09020 [Myxococcus sp. K15C18031901]|uniref:hypothetical protein n=1 Tax=Myxococcus dinghuensis TaxID=2906761 RepID=UPI0020A82835|nr:hypothetical protein [Myxococcus dinghuensis]MCP3099013.1 hypothetical protein [Myxococcus dinghuensis]
MKTARPLLILAPLAALLACASDELPPLCGVDTGLTPRLDIPVFPVHSEVSVRVDVASSLLTCDSGRTVQSPDTARVEVYDPDNHLVDADVTMDVASQVATVRFKPALVGRHHVLLAFSPVGGIQQFGLYASEPWSGTETPVTLSLPRCTQLDRTARGLWLCDGVALREPTGRAQKLGSSSVPPDVAVAGDIVWVVGDGRVRRFKDTGTGTDLELTGSVLQSPQAPLDNIQARLATETELVVLTTDMLVRFVFTADGVLTMSPPTPWQQPTGAAGTFGADNARGLLVRASERRVLTVSLSSGDRSDICPFELDAQGAYAFAQETCQSLRGRPAGLEEGILWTQVGTRLGSSLEGRMLHRWGLEDGWLVEYGSLILDPSLEVPDAPLRAGFVVPTVLTFPRNLATASLPRQLPGRLALGLELLPPTLPPSEGARVTSTRFYWGGDARQNGGSTVVYTQTPH